MQSSRMDLRLESSLKREIEDAAALLGVSLTAFATEALLSKAREVKRESSTTLLDDAERDAFLRLISEPPAPSEALKALMRAPSVD